ncbi:FIST signal transduction protein [Sulfurovum sp. ST-21]|uniref:FIST C-terminal domain-containing protein n=1 Tax=Sulfurovum indicum TaxID=2779528 RepID=A0A7M1S0R1_9BACT|nr:FIST C-terminal domain-containing protein [Sulfurovum indicum]QOR61057.1 FIST C-terminal domain-containing protein [Sulfurovum indicum]
MADIIFDPTASIESFADNMNILSAKNRSVIILACDANGFTKKLIDPILRENTLSVTGGIFPSVIYNDTKYDRGTIFIGLKENIQINIIKDISQKNYDKLDADMEKQIGNIDKSAKTIFVYIDGLTKHIGKCINVLFDNYGLDINYIGGGTGSLSFEQKPSLFTSQGLLQDALVYAHSRAKSSIGVSHGWKSISGPYQVTKSDTTVLKELDFKPAFEVYKSIVDQYASEPINTDNFFQIAKSFPFGINTLSNEKIVRDPIILNGTEMVCVGNVEEGNYVDILQGKKDALIKAAKNAADISNENMDFENDFTLFIDCISRVLFLEEDFSDEIKAVCRNNMPLVGALTFGEIANNGKNHLEFFNKTSVVGHIGHG